MFYFHEHDSGLETVALPDSVNSDFSSASLALARFMESAVVSIHLLRCLPTCSDVFPAPMSWPCPDLSLLHQLELLLALFFLALRRLHSINGTERVSRPLQTPCLCGRLG